MERELERRLDLTGEQRTKVQWILKESHEHIKDLRREFQPRFVSIVEEAESGISAVLSPEQQQRFQKLIGEKEVLWKPKD